MIKLFNSLNSVQSVKIRDQFGKIYTIFIESRSYTEIEGYQITEDIKSKLKSGSLIDLSTSVATVDLNHVGSDSVKISEITVSPIIETNNDKEDTTVNQVLEDSTTESSTGVLKLEKDPNGPFICDICGNEYASSRGLEMHKSKTHK